MRPAQHRRGWAVGAAVSALVVSLAVQQPLAAQGGVLVARIASVTGPALVTSGNSGGAFSVTAGFLLNPGDRVDTRNGGRVVIELSDGSMVVVEPQSTIVFKDFRQAQSLRELFEITLGKVRVKINHFGGRPNPYRMNSPTASIAVRGTEFSIEVRPVGSTEVIVYEGTVQVTSLSDPNQTVLVEAGRGVLVQAGQDFHMLAAAANPGNGHLALDEHGGQSDQAANLTQAATGSSAGSAGSASHGDRDMPSPRATASAYDSYIESLSDIAQMPFLFRFNAFPEAHLDSLENPAYATQFSAAEARIVVLPTFGGGPDLDDNRAVFGPAANLPNDYSISPQLSIFTPVGHSNFFVGASVSGSRATNNSALASPDEDSSSTGQNSSSVHSYGASTSSFYSGSLLAARRIGGTSFGVELESLRGSGSLFNTNTDTDGQPSVEQIFAVSGVSQTRLTAGLSHDFGKKLNLGAFYRYGWISAFDHDRSHTVNNVPVALNSTDSAGHSSEVGMRLRGVWNPRIFYGFSGAWSGVSLTDALVRTGTVNSGETDRGQRASVGGGLGYVLSRRTVLTFDGAGGTSRVASSRFEDATGNLLQNGTANGHFVSGHAALQIDLSRQLFLSASYLNVWREQHLNVNLFPDQFGATIPVQDSFFPLTPTAYDLASHFSDFGVGWRFSPTFFVQYLLTTDYGVTSSSHSLLLRYTFKLGKRE